MAAGGGITYPRVIGLLKKAVAERGQRAVSREAGIALLSVQRYIKGESEPSQATLEKLAAYFGVSVAWLRGGEVGLLERFLEGIKLAKVTQDVFNEKISGVFVPKSGKIEKGDIDFWGQMVAGDLPLTNKTIAPMCELFSINAYWVTTGSTPPSNYSGGIVGTLKKRPDLDFNLVEPLGSGVMVASCSRCGGAVMLHLDRGETGNNPLIATVEPCTTCCKA